MREGTVPETSMFGQSALSSVWKTTKTTTDSPLLIQSNI